MLTYTYRYNRTIQWFKDHPISKETHPDSEYHHIIPCSCGGEDIKENKVLLPTRWHYIVHCWLPAVYLEQGNQEYYEKMLFAWNRMQNYREDFRSGLQTIKEDSKLYQKLRDEYNKILGKKMSFVQSGKNNSHYEHHWWKDPNDKTKSLSIKEGDPVPEGWIRGRWQIQSENTFAIYNNETNKCRYIKNDSEIPEGWHKFEKTYQKKVATKSKWQNKKNTTIEIVVKHAHCRWCGAIKTKKKYYCKHPDLCAHNRLIPKMIQYFGFDVTAIGTERYYEEYNRIKDYLYDLYFIQQKSLVEICNIIGYKPGPCPFANFMKSLFGKDSLRSFTESSTLAWKQGKIK